MVTWLRRFSFPQKPGNVSVDNMGKGNRTKSIEWRTTQKYKIGTNKSGLWTLSRKQFADQCFPSWTSNGSCSFEIASGLQVHHFLLSNSQREAGHYTTRTASQCSKRNEKLLTLSTSMTNIMLLHPKVFLMYSKHVGYYYCALNAGQLFVRRREVRLPSGTRTNNK